MNRAASGVKSGECGERILWMDAAEYTAISLLTRIEKYIAEQACVEDPGAA